MKVEGACRGKFPTGELVAPEVMRGHVDGGSPAGQPRQQSTGAVQGRMGAYSRDSRDSSPPAGRRAYSPDSSA